MQQVLPCRRGLMGHSVEEEPNPKKQETRKKEDEKDMYKKSRTSLRSLSFRLSPLVCQQHRCEGAMGGSRMSCGRFQRRVARRSTEVERHERHERHGRHGWEHNENTNCAPRKEPIRGQLDMPVHNTLTHNAPLSPNLFSLSAGIVYWPLLLYSDDFSLASWTVSLPPLLSIVTTTAPHDSSVLLYNMTVTGE